jgi:hypothetical protein
MPIRNGFRSDCGRCGNSELVTSGIQTTSRGATAKTSGRNQGNLASGLSSSAPQHPQNSPSGTFEPQPAQISVGTTSLADTLFAGSSLVDAIVILSAKP